MKSFFKYSKEDRRAQLTTNTRITTISTEPSRRFAEVQSTLTRYNKRRLQQVDSTFKKVRRKVHDKYGSINKYTEEKSNNNNNSNELSNRHVSNDTYNTNSSAKSINMDDTQRHENTTQQQNIHIPKESNNNKRRWKQIYGIQKGHLDDILRRKINQYDIEREKRSTRRIEFNKSISSYNTRAKQSINTIIDYINKQSIRTELKSIISAILSRFKNDIKQSVNKVSEKVYKESNNIVNRFRM